MSLAFAPKTLNGRNVLVSFRAGTMTIADGMATPDTGKGFLVVIQSLSGLIEFWWQPSVEIPGGPEKSSTMVTFGDATFEQVEKCKPSVVFALCLNGSKDPAHTRLYWAQEPRSLDTDVLKIKRLIGDAECRKRMQAAGGEAAASTATATSGTAPAAVPASSSAATSSTAPTAPAPAAAAKKGPITNEALQAILQNLSRARPVDINLQQMLGSDEMLAALREDPAFYMSRIGENLPPNHSNDIVAEIRNPQASAAAATLQAAVSESPNTLNEVLTAFGLPKPAGTAGAPTASATALCEAIVKAAEEKAASPAGGNAENQSAPSPPADK